MQHLNSSDSNLKSYTKRLYWCVIFYMTANSLVLPITPYFATSLNATNTQYSLVFTVYYVAMLISSFVFGKIGDTFGRKIGLSISLFGLTFFTICQIYSKDANMYIVFRFLGGLFDAQTSMFQACIGDVTSSHQRAHYLSQLEAINNIAQAIGPFIGGILSAYSLSASLWYACGCYIVSLLLVLSILPESLSILLEKRKIIENLKSQHLSRKAFEERKQRLFYQLSLQHESSTSHSKKKKKFKFNYVMGIAIIGEFCCRWLISVFDISVAQFAEEQHQMSSFEFSMASALGSIINTFQTGWLFNRFLSWDISIPMITSLCGVAGAIGVMICVYSTSKAADFIASLFILMAYGFAAPTAPTIMSTESSADTQGMAVALVLIGGQSAYMTAPSILSAAYSHSITLPFLISLIPCGLVFVSMIILHYIPGGCTAGQVPLEFAMESYLKNQKMSLLENDEEFEVLATGSRVKHKEDRESKKLVENDVMIEMSHLRSKKHLKDNNDGLLADSMVDEESFMVRPRADSYSSGYTVPEEEVSPKRSKRRNHHADVSSSDDDMAI